MTQVGLETHTGHMTESEQIEQDGPIEIPPLTRGWRMQMALAHGGHSVEYMAAKCTVSRSTVSRWLHDDGRPPRRGDLELWARECRVPVDWLDVDQGDSGFPSALQATEGYRWQYLRSFDGGGELTERLYGHLCAAS